MEGATGQQWSTCLAGTAGRLTLVWPWRRLLPRKDLSSEDQDELQKLLGELKL